MECNGTPVSAVINIYYYIVFCWSSDMELRLGLRAGRRARSLKGKGGRLGLTELIIISCELPRRPDGAAAAKGDTHSKRVKLY